ncbi:hypothetical protein SAMN05421821_10256 [Mucilaginibacter lappiensis]|uniref:Phage protein n=1 Tax=Mucilaginibacter lappiensis TaxID=354630 RepID=A0ABR6PG27_9SPHI|nr:hypothetical protein [Mucilaginibacter lappiensis]MBB6108709.1 hypothetical protein [Mucilaginibacter lappiensis]SIQ26987.1 hypothetical protein SAMN05421821_10256 [Mucilaginibacter lappiensis]
MKASELQINIDDKLSAAFNFLDDFFDSGLPKEHRKDLKKWRFHVINDEQYNGRHGAGHVFLVYEETIQLIEIAHTLMGHNEISTAAIDVTEDDIEQEKMDWIYFPTNLSQKELVDPFKTIEIFFESTTVDQYKDLLHEWLRVALSNKAALEMLSAKEIIDVYDKLRKLYSAAWLIHQRK